MKKILTFIFALVTVLTICSVSVLAADTEAIAKIGDTEYTSLQEAIDAAQEGDTVTLVSDIVPTAGLVVPTDSYVVLDLAGYSISQSVECTASYQMIANNGTLYITDSVGGGKISFTDTGVGDAEARWGSYTIRNAGTLVVENATIENLSEQNKDQTSFKHTTLAIFQYSGSCTINSGIISTPYYRSVRLWSGDMTINGGTFDGQVWIHCVNNTASMTINGGEFSPNGMDGSSVFANNSGYVVGLSVTGGSFATKVGANDTAALAGSITGGTFSANAIASMGENSVLFGGSLIANDDGSFSVAITLENAFKFLGYSINSEMNSITAGFTVDQELLAMYIEQNGLTGFDFGCAFGVDEINDGTYISFARYTEYQTFNAKIIGIDANNERHTTANLMMALYIDLGDGNGKSYVVGTGVNNNVKFVAADAVTSVTFGSLIQD